MRSLIKYALIPMKCKDLDGCSQRIFAEDYRFCLGKVLWWEPGLCFSLKMLDYPGEEECKKPKEWLLIKN